jgi:hypothetical protein
MNLTENKSIPTDQPFQIVKYDSSVDDINTLTPMVDTAYQANVDFFGQKAKGIQVNFVYSDEELASVMPFAFQPWHKAFAKGNSVWVFSPTLPKGSQLERRLTHEQAHIFTNQIFGSTNPNWLREGIACLVANQYPETDGLSIDTTVGFDKLHYAKDWQSNSKYKRSDFFVKYLIGNYGKDTLFKLMSQIVPRIKSNNSPEQFSQLFGEVYPQSFVVIEQTFLDQYPKSVQIKEK